MSRQAHCVRPASAARPLRRALSTPLMGVPGLSSMYFPAKSKTRVPNPEDEVIPERWMFVVVRREKITQAVGRIIQVQKKA
ncbi:hypothetical protein BDQ17DRAFT_1344312 [Cyathus striatus]|nr:hypothetical protein BDQ17DRAFT_1344312 [Cyathus striatus]